MLMNDDLVKTTLISGEQELCKAFLFETAIEWAKEGQHVYYFAAKQFESLPLSLHDRSEPSADALKLMTFIYTPTYNELAAQLLRLHTFRRRASVLIIDDLDFFAGKTCPIRAARCCAVILNAAIACSNAAGGNPVRVCAGSFQYQSELKNIYRVYFDNQWIVSSEPGESEELRKVWLRNKNDTKAFEFCRLDDPVLVLKTVFARDDGDIKERS